MQIDDLIHELTNGKETFDFEIYFSEVFHEKRGFDLLIGNPPYLNFKSYSSADRELYKQLYREVFDGKADLLYYFIFKGMTLANARATCHSSHHDTGLKPNLRQSCESIFRDITASARFWTSVTP